MGDDAPASAMNPDAEHRRDSLMVDPNRAHLFVRNDHDRLCYRCGDKYEATIHDGPWRRGDRRWDR